MHREKDFDFLLKLFHKNESSVTDDGKLPEIGKIKP
tara:strand:- start:436 stop:543 length:108 start_codon:yes stop_codon:yes gene_type:complete